LARGTTNAAANSSNNEYDDYKVGVNVIHYLVSFPAACLHRKRKRRRVPGA
jgi:hypothetical protein